MPSKTKKNCLTEELKTKQNKQTNQKEKLLEEG